MSILRFLPEFLAKPLDKEIIRHHIHVDPFRCKMIYKDLKTCESLTHEEQWFVEVYEEEMNDE